MKVTMIALTALCLFGSRPCVASESGGAAAAYLNSGVGARAAAMGKAFTAVADDASASYWNPAGLAGTEGTEIEAAHGALQEDRALNSISLAYGLGSLALGACWLSFGVSDIQERDRAGSLIGHFNDAENAFMVSAGWRPVNTRALSLRVGITGKYLRHSLQDYSASGQGIDLGALAEFQLAPEAFTLAVGAAYQNAGATMKWDTDSEHEDEVPSAFRAGVAGTLESLPLTMSIDLSRTEDQDALLHLGGEVIVGSFALRAGLDDADIAAGAGYRFLMGRTQVSINYAFADDDLSDSGRHLFSLGLGLGQRD